ncbi:MAG: hypothetical protein L0K86_06620 [Actinomycetia bacterium]|nr:hypothetical protein [Actinomycetes bacterium]
MRIAVVGGGVVGKLFTGLTRVTLDSVVSAFRAGATAEQIAVITYYLRRRTAGRGRSRGSRMGRG